MKYYVEQWKKKWTDVSRSVTCVLLCRNFLPFLDKQSNVQDHFSVSPSMDSSDFSITHSSPNHEKVALSAVELQHDYVQTYNVHEAGISAEKCDALQESQFLIFRETIDDGPLGEVFRSKTSNQHMQTS
jgi:hypothetical protein